MKCKYCEHFRFEREIQLYSNSPIITLGTCGYDSRDFGNKTMSISESCQNFVEHGHKYQVRDVLVNKNKVLFIHHTQEDYYPTQYRVTDNTSSTYSMSEEDFEKQGFTLIRLEDE